MADNGDDTLSFTHDLAGQLLSEDSSANASTVAYTYDLAGNRLTVSLDGAVHASYAYDDAGRLASITRAGQVFGFAYDNANRRTQLTYPNGIATTYVYDTLSRLTRLKADLGATAITDFQYLHDAVGNRTRKQQLDYTEDYSYDALYRLTQAARGGVTTESYTYDSVGNRLSSLGSGPWTYSDRNELLSQNGTTYTYDAAGNLSQKTDGTDTWAYEWNAENQLTGVTKNGLEQARFAYDPLGRRVEKVAGGVTTVYTYDAEYVLREVRGGSTSKYVHGLGIDEPLAWEDGSGVLAYYHADALGSIVKRTSQAGAVVHEHRYDAWGNIETGASEPGFAFTGREWEPETGLYYYRARYYDPKLGRFVSEDPIGFLADSNFYRYVYDNPVSYTDPLGLDVQMCSRQMQHIPPWLVKVPHPIVYSTQAKKGWGFGPAGTTLPGVPDAGHVGEEDPYDPKSKGKYSCSTVSTSNCVEDCVRRRAQAATTNPPPIYKSAPKNMGGYQCNDWAWDVIMSCEEQCKK